MAEIKLTEGFAAEVAAFRASREQLDQVRVETISAGGLSLPTVDAYQKRLHQIWQIMVLFEALVKKDADDMDALADSLRATDVGG